MADLAGRYFLVTGANSGIGLATVTALVGRGAVVTLAGRSEERTRAAMAGVLQEIPSAELHYLPLDLASLAATRDAADQYLSTGRPLDVLINNAGVAGVVGMTGDGLDLTIGTNHVGPYLFTKVLLPRLLERPAPRVVNLASHAHTRVVAVAWEDVRVAAASVVRSFDRYLLSKLFNIVHARELARRYGGEGLVTASVHPGGVASNIWRQMPAPVRWGASLFMLSNERGAQAPVYCATSPDVVSGAFYNRLRLGTASAHADDPQIAERLFAWSDEVVAPYTSAR